MGSTCYNNAPRLQFSLCEMQQRSVEAQRTAHCGFQDACGFNHSTPALALGADYRNAQRIKAQLLAQTPRAGECSLNFNQQPDDTKRWCPRLGYCVNYNYFDEAQCTDCNTTGPNPGNAF